MTMKTISKKQTGVKVAATIKAGGLPIPNHNRVLAVKSAIKAGQSIVHANHNRAISVKSAIKAGQSIVHANHNRRAA
jgi:hypothetical protein